MANPPAFATIGYTVDVGQRTASDAINSMGQDLQTSPVGGALLYMGWSAPIVESVDASADGLTVRRMITFATPGALPNGQFPYPTEEAIVGCLSNLYTGQLEAYCGKPVTALAPVVWDDPVTILGTSLLSWWTAVQIGNALSGFPVAGPPANTPWSSTNGSGLGGVDLNQAVGANQFVLGAPDALLGRGQGAVSDGAAAKEMTNAAPFAALAQPWNVAVIGHAAAAASAGQWLGGNGGSCELSRTGANLTFSTDGGGSTLVGPPKDGGSHLMIATANGLGSTLIVDGQTYPGSAGPGTPAAITALADAAAANNLAATLTDIIVGASARPWTPSQTAALLAYAQGRYGIGYGTGF